MAFWKTSGVLHITRCRCPRKCAGANDGTSEVVWKVAVLSKISRQQLIWVQPPHALAHFVAGCTTHPRKSYVRAH